MMIRSNTFWSSEVEGAHDRFVSCISLLASSSSRTIIGIVGQASKYTVVQPRPFPVVDIQTAEKSFRTETITR